MRRRLLFVGNNPAYFLSHRLPAASGARAAGYEVHVAAPDGPERAEIERRGFAFHPVPFDRGRRARPLAELRTFSRLAAAIRAVRPDLLHCHTIKPVLYGGALARLLGVPAAVYGVTGLGWVFVAEGAKARALRVFAKAAYRFAFGKARSRAVFQNPDDLRDFDRWGLVAPKRAALIRGSGVDTARFAPRPEPEGDPVVVLASRLLWDKGVGVFVDAARALRAEGSPARFLLAGDDDPGNPASVPRETLEAWGREGAVRLLGHVADVPRLYASAHVVCLPSHYREGVPKALIEAAACGRPIVATDAPGCREICVDGVNGLLVPPKDPRALADALRRLLADPALRREMGARGRELAEKEFSEERVVAETLAVYAALAG